MLSALAAGALALLCGSALWLAAFGAGAALGAGRTGAPKPAGALARGGGDLCIGADAGVRAGARGAVRGARALLLLL